jgi:branched-subunit amino acid transport system permease
MLRTANFGLRLRALADNPIQFALYGYNVDAHRLLAFAMAGVFAAAAALVTANDIGFDPQACTPPCWRWSLSSSVDAVPSSAPSSGACCWGLSVRRWCGTFRRDGRRP